VTQEVKIGNKVRDRVTGLTGIATSRTTYFQRAPMIGIQPEGDGTTAPEPTVFDDNMVEFVDVGVADAVPPAQDVSHITLGDLVRDRASGFEGHAMSATTFLNGCVQFGVQAMGKTKHELPAFQSFSASTIEKIGAGLNSAPDAEEKREKNQGTGGPNTKIKRAPY
jgi:hypothetical protein